MRLTAKASMSECSHAMLVTDAVRHFTKVPGLKVEDWS
jgi:predicted nucleic acid-binding protein